MEFDKNLSHSGTLIVELTAVLFQLFVTLFIVIGTKKGASTMIMLLKCSFSSPGSQSLTG